MYGILYTMAKGVCNMSKYQSNYDNIIKKSCLKTAVSFTAGASAQIKKQ